MKNKKLISFLHKVADLTFAGVQFLLASGMITMFIFTLMIWLVRSEEIVKLFIYVIFWEIMVYSALTICLLITSLLIFLLSPSQPTTSHVESNDLTNVLSQIHQDISQTKLYTQQQYINSMHDRIKGYHGYPSDQIKDTLNRF